MGRRGCPPTPDSRPVLGTSGTQAGVAQTLAEPACGAGPGPLTLCLLPVGGMAGVKRPPSATEEELPGKKAPRQPAGPSPTPAQEHPLSPISTNAIMQRKEGGAQGPPLKAVSAQACPPSGSGVFRGLPLSRTGGAECGPAATVLGWGGSQAPSVQCGQDMMPTVQTGKARPREVTGGHAGGAELEPRTQTFLGSEWDSCLCLLSVT